MIWIWAILILVCLLALTNFDNINNNNRDENNRYFLIYFIMFFVLWITPVWLFSITTDTFNRPLKQTIHVKLENNLPIDTTYTYE